MLISEYIQAGFELSKQYDQTKVDRAEADVTTNYIIPICGEYDEEQHANELMALAFCLTLRRNVFKTRTGSEMKSNDFATVLNFEAGELNRYISVTAMNAIRSLMVKAGITDKVTTITDIIDCGYYIV